MLIGRLVCTIVFLAKLLAHLQLVRDTGVASTAHRLQMGEKGCKLISCHYSARPPVSNSFGILLVARAEPRELAKRRYRRRQLSLHARRAAAAAPLLAQQHDGAH